MVYIKEKLRVLSLFSGIGAFEEGLKSLNIAHEVVGFSEIDKYAIEAYSVIHGVSKDLNLGDVSKIDINTIPDCDLVTYGFPCTNISVAGLQEGIVQGETASGLLFEALKIIKNKQPKYAIAENVKALVGKKFKDDFQKLLNTLSALGYNSYYEVMNAKDYGGVQGRERIFIVSIRKDIDDGKFEFPKPFESNYTLADILEDEVDDKYTVPRSMIENWYKKKPPFGNRFTLKKYDDIAYTLVAKGGRAVITNNYILKNEEDYSKVSEFSRKESIGQILDKDLDIRSLTPLEYWRLMGFSDEDYIKGKEKLESTVSTGRAGADPQMYKMAGNSICVNVLEGIYKKLFL